MPDAVPSYDPLQSAFHEAFRSDLDRAIADLGLVPGTHVLDAPAGNGFYSRLLADHLAPGGRLTVVDTNAAYRQQAEEALADAPAGVAVEILDADVYQLPFPDSSFDFIWCAQSLISLDDNVRALREVGRVTKPGGRIAVLEADEFHHVLLPWPVGLEVAVQRAVLQASRRKYGSGSRLAPARHLRAGLAAAGWQPTEKRTVAADRTAPFAPAEVEFLTHHLEYIGKLVRDHLEPDHRADFDHLADPTDPDGFARRAVGEMTCGNTLHLARKPV